MLRVLLLTVLQPFGCSQEDQGVQVWCFGWSSEIIDKMDNVWMGLVLIS